jgi:ANTAR domain
LAQLLLATYPLQGVLDRVGSLGAQIVAGSEWAECTLREPAPATAAVAGGLVDLPLSVCASGQETVIAVLTLHGPADAFEGFEPKLIEPFLTQAAITVHNSRELHKAVELTAQLREALASRAVIEQAKGAIMARRHVSAVSAFELLRRSSQRRNVKLRDVAQEVVDSTQPR